MSAAALLQAAVAAALSGHAPLAGALTAVFDAPPGRASRPYALVEEAVLADWGTKDMAGREGRIAISLHDVGERPARLRGLAGELDAAIEAMPRTLGQGWAVASLVFLRGRILREGEGRWVAVNEYRVRMLRSEL